MSDAGAIDEQQDMLRLNRGERLLVSTLRRIVLGWDLCAAITREFSDTCGQEAGEVLATVRVFLVAVGCTARRRVSVGPPGWLGLTSDERQILVMISAAQCGDEPRLDALVSWLARLEAQPLLAQAAHALATALSAHDLRMCGTTPAAEEDPAGHRALARMLFA